MFLLLDNRLHFRSQFLHTIVCTHIIKTTTAHFIKQVFDSCFPLLLDKVPLVNFVPYAFWRVDLEYLATNDLSEGQPSLSWKVGIDSVSGCQLRCSDGSEGHQGQSAD